MHKKVNWPKGKPIIWGLFQMNLRTGPLILSQLVDLQMSAVPVPCHLSSRFGLYGYFSQQGVRLTPRASYAMATDRLCYGCSGMRQGATCGTDVARLRLSH